MSRHCLFVGARAGRAQFTQPAGYAVGDMGTKVFAVPGQYAHLWTHTPRRSLLCALADPRISRLATGLCVGVHTARRLVQRLSQLCARSRPLRSRFRGTGHHHSAHFRSQASRHLPLEFAGKPVQPCVEGEAIRRAREFLRDKTGPPVKLRGKTRHRRV